MRGRNACRRALKIVRKQMGHQTISSVDAVFCQKHLAECDCCRADRVVLKAMVSDGDTPRFDELSARRFADKVLDRLDNESIVHQKQYSLLTRLAAGMAVAVVLGGLVWAVQWKTQTNQNDTFDRGGASEDREHQSEEMEVSVLPAKKEPNPVKKNDHDSRRASGTFHQQMPHQIPENEEIQAPHLSDLNEKYRIVLADGVVLEAYPNTDLTLIQSDNLAVTVALHLGEVVVSVDPNKITPVVSVQTRLARTTVTGTVFTVSVTSEKQQVSVLKGEVLVQSQNGDVQTVGAHRLMVLDTGRLSTLSMNEVEAGLAKAPPLDSDQSVDGTADIIKVKVLDWRSTPAKKASRSWRKEHSLNGKSLGDTSSELPESVMIRNILHEARRYRRERDWNSVVRVYRALISRFPRSGEAASAQVALADVLLRHMKDAKKALAYFEQYLHSGKATLREEALMGRADALIALGREGEAKAVLQTFILQYPRSIHFSAANRRLSSLN